MAGQIGPAAQVLCDMGRIEGGAVAGEGDRSFDRITEILADGRFHGGHDAAAQGVADVDLLACNCDMHWSDSFLSAAPERGTLVCTGHAAKPSGFSLKPRTGRRSSRAAAVPRQESAGHRGTLPPCDGRYRCPRAGGDRKSVV